MSRLLSNSGGRGLKDIPEYPDFDFIIKEVKEKMDKRFLQYGNSWKDKSNGLDFWERRLQHEVSEWALRRLDSDELIDMIAVACMIREKLRG